MESFQSKVIVITGATYGLGNQVTHLGSRRVVESFQSKVIVITGATYGLGNDMAREFLRLGHKVAGCGRTDAIVRQLTQEV